MNKGKYSKPVSAGGIFRKPVILAVCLVLIGLLAASGTMALIHMATGPVVNTFTPAKVEVTINETVDNSTKSNITITNPGPDTTPNPNPDAVPVYVRATLVIYWQDTIDGNLVTIAPPAGAAVSIGAVQKDWFEINGIYYYTQKLEPGETTSVMLNPITVTVPEGSTAQCVIDVRAEAIQAEPADAVTSAWTDVKVSTDGMLTGGNGT